MIKATADGGNLPSARICSPTKLVPAQGLQLAHGASREALPGPSPHPTINTSDLTKRTGLGLSAKPFPQYDVFRCLTMCLVGTSLAYHLIPSQTLRSNLTGRGLTRFAAPPSPRIIRSYADSANRGVRSRHDSCQPSHQAEPRCWLRC